MIQKIKDALNNSLTWLLFLVGCIFLLWKKEKHMEDQLREQKFDSSIKETKDEQAKIDGDAALDAAAYAKLRADYLSGSAPGVRQGSAGSEKADPDQGFKN